MLADYKIRIIANACITRDDNGEGDIITIIDSYQMETADRDKALTYIHTKRPHITQETPA